MTEPKAGVKPANNLYKMNTVTPGCAEAQLGDRIAELETQLNALLVHLDAGAVTGIGTTNAATYGVTPIDQDVPSSA